VANDSSTGGYLAPTTALPAEDAALDAILVGLVAGVVGLPGNLVRPRWQLVPPTQPEASTDWCAIGVVDEDPDPNISLLHSGVGQGSSTSVDNDIITVLASFYGPSARGNAKVLRTGLMIPQNREKLYFVGLALVEIPGKSRFLPDMVNQRTLRRVDISMRFRRRTVLNWTILNLLQMQGTVATDLGVSDPLQTPQSVSPLVE
jgi:hypothetical protein